MKLQTHPVKFMHSGAACLLGLLAVPLLAAITGCAVLTISEPSVTKVTFNSLDPVKPLLVPAEFRVPPGKKLPAVVIVHGSSGIDSRGVSYARELNAAGIATLEIDLWGARGITTGAVGRPRSVTETLPDAYGALKYLAEQANIDTRRIGIMGFSWGGVVSMLTATVPYTQKYMTGTGLAFAAHAPNYPVCWVYNHVPGYEFNSFTGAKILLQGGDLDTFDLPDTCPGLMRSSVAIPRGLLTVKMYPGATHGFDRSEPAMTAVDPFSHLGKGGEVRLAPNPEAAAQARATTVAFFRTQFGM